MDRLLRAVLATVVLSAAACGNENVSVDRQPLSPTAVMPTFTEHLDSRGTIIAITGAEQWDGTSYPIRIVRQNESGEIVSEKVLTQPPTFDLAETINQMTPAQINKMKRALEAAAAQSPKSSASDALDIMEESLGRKK